MPPRPISSVQPIRPEHRLLRRVRLSTRRRHTVLRHIMLRHIIVRIRRRDLRARDWTGLQRHVATGVGPLRLGVGVGHGNEHLLTSAGAAASLASDSGSAATTLRSITQFRIRKHSRSRVNSDPQARGLFRWRAIMPLSDHLEAMRDDAEPLQLSEFQERPCSKTPVPATGPPSWAVGDSRPVYPPCTWSGSR